MMKYIKTFALLLLLVPFIAHASSFQINGDTTANYTVASNMGITSGAYTFGLWVNAFDIPGVNSSWTLAYTSDATVEKMILYRNLAGTIVVNFRRDLAAGASCNRNITKTLDANKWYYVVFNYDATNAQGWVFDPSANSWSTTGAFACAGAGSGNSDITQVGGQANGNTSANAQYFRATNFAIYNTALSFADIQKVSTKRPHDNATNLVGFWNFDENTGTTAYDHTIFRRNMSQTSTASRVGFQQPFPYKP